MALEECENETPDYIPKINGFSAFEIFIQTKQYFKRNRLSLAKIKSHHKH